MERLKARLSEIDYSTIGLYMPLGDEPDLRPLYRELEAMGRSLYLPRVLDRERIVYHRYRCGDSLEESQAFSLNEPLPTAKPMEGDIDILVVPAVHYYKGYRLGRGKGYYDRYLAEHSPKHLIGVTLNLLGDASFAIDPWDKPMHEVLTPKN